MAVEIEKKYRLTNRDRDTVRRRLDELGAKFQAEEFEENTLYGGEGLDIGKNVLRLRRVANKATLTYKERFPGDSAIRHQREDETTVDDPEAMNLILEAIGLVRAVVYEKRRETWLLGNAEIVIDELPFGLFMEIEGDEAEINAVERRLGLKDLLVEHSTYPQLAHKLGRLNGNVIEARFTDL